MFQLCLLNDFNRRQGGGKDIHHQSCFKFLTSQLHISVQKHNDVKMCMQHELTCMYTDWDERKNRTPPHPKKKKREVGKGLRAGPLPIY